MDDALPILTLLAIFTLLSGLVIFSYHYLYRSSLTVVGKAELEWVVPALVPGFLISWWLLGVFDSVVNARALPNDLWTWWMPVGALVVFGVSRQFAIWNRARLIKRRPRYP